MIFKALIKKILKASFPNRQKDIRRFKSCGANVVIENGSDFLNERYITLGDNVYIGPNAWLHAGGEIIINDGSIIGPRCKIYTLNHNYNSDIAIPYDDIIISKNVIINENVWIGGDVIILPGAEIGEGCIVAAGSVVTKKWPPYKILGGNPCRVIGERNVNQYKRLKEEGKIYLKLKKEGKMHPHISVNEYR
ncbi:acyltransferase [Carboxylicivirga taeanensis]|uniref:acyltransferase n=1 Tax=Carboxylicivirga taeanensis TaxID=1416875 RepID=UPI003F6E2273